MSRVRRLCPVFRTQPGAYPPETQKPDVAPTCGTKIRPKPSAAASVERGNAAEWTRPAACSKCGNTPKRAKSRDFGRRGEKAGESQGVVRAPWQTHLPAVRAVWGFRVGVVERAKTAPLGSEAQIIPLFQGKQRGHTQNWREISMANRKIKFPLWLMPETKATVERL